MKILFYEWGSYMYKGIEDALTELDIEYDMLFYQQSDWEEDEKFAELVRTQIKSHVYDAVFSVNFVPVLSNVCEEAGLRYVSWVYDSPMHIRNLEPMKNSCNEIYLFDRGQVEVYRALGVPMKHMLLAADVKNFQKVIGAGRSQGYQCDVSLLGKMYRTEYAEYISPLGEYTKGFLEGLIRAHSKIYGDNLIPELITDEFLEKMNREYSALNLNFQMGRRELEFLLASEITGRERYTALSLLSNHYDVQLYSPNKMDIKNLKQKGSVDYYSGMPQVFAASRINLNISLKAIRTGIPLRVMDIMACGGFVMSNYQVEVLENFEIGTECEVYENMEDLFYKVKFYLEHEDIRKQIARNAFERVKRDFTFRERLDKMLVQSV